MKEFKFFVSYFILHFPNVSFILVYCKCCVLKVKHNFFEIYPNNTIISMK